MGQQRSDAVFGRGRLDAELECAPVRGDRLLVAVRFLQRGSELLLHERILGESGRQRLRPIEDRGARRRLHQAEQHDRDRESRPFERVGEPRGHPERRGRRVGAAAVEAQ
jgi:hypothetical protein